MEKRKGREKGEEEKTGKGNWKGKPKEKLEGEMGKRNKRGLGR